MAGRRTARSRSGRRDARTRRARVRRPRRCAVRGHPDRPNRGAPNPGPNRLGDLALPIRWRTFVLAGGRRYGSRDPDDLPGPRAGPRMVAELVRAAIMRRLIPEGPPTMKPRILALVLAATAFAVPVRADNQSAPYAGQQARSIKSLSAEDVAALLKGEGMGMAKAAELNGYPGPVHVLTLAS